MYFNSTLIHANSVTEGNLFDPYNTFFNDGTINNTNGTITDVYGYTDPVNNVTDIGCFCYISFTAQQEIGTSPLELDGVVILNASGIPVPLIVSNGSVTIVDSVVSISPSTQFVGKGETFTVSVYVEPAEPITGITIGKLSFNAAFIHANSVTLEGFFDPYNTTFSNGTINNTNGEITNIYEVTSPINNVSTDGYFCNISFTAQQEFGTSPLDLEDVIISNATGGEASVTINDGKVVVMWSTTLYFNETSGINDYVVFGEVADANDGGEPDDYDVPKPPASMPPYIRGWFDDDLPAPYDYLWEDYRQYPDTYKMWDMYVEWENSSSTPICITISWDTSEFDDCWYNSIVLTRYDPFGEEWDFAADMLTEEEYVYSPRYFASDWLIDHFQITAALDTTPPEITNVAMITSDPLDTISPYGWENFFCTVTDDIEVDGVQLNLTYPDLHTEYIPMNKDGDNYYYNITLTAPGGHWTPGYTYSIYANDTYGRTNTSTPEEFALPMNEDVSVTDGKVHFMDLVAVSLMYNAVGPCGWVREDVDNGGNVHFMDIIAISLAYNDVW